MKIYKNINGFPLDLLAKRVKTLSEQDAVVFLDAVANGGSVYNEYGEVCSDFDEPCDDYDYSALLSQGEIERANLEMLEYR
ncbi:MAG: hypothetical protein FWH20_02235 [Oscillospiraceae bacterium]|nr:hypothetical protein [Oscillospiraceae bacterium]